MRYTDRIKNLAPLYPELVRIWIKTGDPLQPLKSVWISESALRSVDGDCRQSCEAEIADLTEDHLLSAA